MFRFGTGGGGFLRRIGNVMGLSSESESESSDESVDSSSLKSSRAKVQCRDTAIVESLDGKFLPPKDPFRHFDTFLGCMKTNGPFTIHFAIIKPETSKSKFL